MRRSPRGKKEYKCSKCGKTYLRWQGMCSCGAGATIEEVVIKAATPTASVETIAARRLRRRAKDSERDIAKRMTSVDGKDPAYANIASSTGRIGHITGIRVDAVSLTYVTENKNRKMPTWIIKAWILINQKATDFNKNALLHIEPPNMPKTVQVNGTAQKLDNMAIITQTRHEELIRAERAFKAFVERLEGEDNNSALLSDVYNIYLGKTDA